MLAERATHSYSGCSLQRRECQVSSRYDWLPYAAQATSVLAGKPLFFFYRNSNEMQCRTGTLIGGQDNETRLTHGCILLLSYATQIHRFSPCMVLSIAKQAGVQQPPLPVPFPTDRAHLPHWPRQQDMCSSFMSHKQAASIHRLFALKIVHKGRHGQMNHTQEACSAELLAIRGEAYYAVLTQCHRLQSAGPGRLVHALIHDVAGQWVQLKKLRRATAAQHQRYHCCYGNGHGSQLRCRVNSGSHSKFWRFPSGGVCIYIKTGLS